MQTPKELAIEKRVFQWYKQSNFPKIIKAVEKLNPNTRSTAMDALLAHSYTKTSQGWKGRKQNLKAVSLIKDLERDFKSTKDEYLPMLWLADAYWSLEQYNNALEYYLRAKDLASNQHKSETLNEAINICDHRRSLSLFTETFKERVEEAWKEFLKREAEFRNILDKDINGERSKELNQKIQSVLNIAIQGNSASLEKVDGKYLIKFLNYLAVYADSMLLFEIQYFKKQCPDSVKQNWDIEINDPILTFEGKDKAVFNKIKIWINRESSGLYAIEAFPEGKLEEILGYTPKYNDFVMILTMILSVVSRVCLSKFITLSKVLSEPRYDPYLLLTDLQGFLVHNGVDIYADTEKLLNQEIPYTRELPKDWNAKAFREDVIFGKSKCVKMLLEYDKGNEEPFSRLEGDGIVVGSLYFKHGEFKEENKDENIRKYKEEIKKFFFDNVGEDGIKYFGEAHGDIYEYIDVVVWDSRKFFKACLNFTELDFKPLVSFHSFFRTAPAINFNKQEGTADLKKLSEAVDLLSEIGQHVSL